MPPLPTSKLTFLERVAVAQVRQKREHYLEALDEILTSFGIAGEAASLDEIRAMFTRYDKPGMPTLSSEIEAVREERWSTSPLTRALSSSAFAMSLAARSSMIRSSVSQLTIYVAWWSLP